MMIPILQLYNAWNQGMGKELEPEYRIDKISVLSQCVLSVSVAKNWFSHYRALASEENLRFLAFEQMSILLMINVGMIMIPRLLSLGVLRFRSLSEANIIFNFSRKFLVNHFFTNF